MSGIYGNFLLAFPEQFTTLTVYNMTPGMNAGWTKVEGSDIVCRGILQNSSGKQIKDSNGNKVKSSHLEFWTDKPELDGMFTKIKSTTYILNTANEWTKEGDFARYILEKVVGNDGAESTSTAWNSGAGHFG